MDNDLDARDAGRRPNPAVVAGLPKVVLHDHLDGGARPGTLIELAAEAGYPDLPAADPGELADWFLARARSGCRAHVAEALGHVRALTGTAAAVTRLAREAVADLAADNVVYAELRIAPELHLHGGLDPQQVVDAAVAGLRAGEAEAAEAGHPITARLIVSARRDGARTEEIARLVADNVPENADHPYVVAFDLCGPEEGNPPSAHRAAFDLLRRKLTASTVHAGEDAGVASIREAVIAGANRIGHGVRIYEDFAASLDGVELQFLSGHIRDLRIPLELCPTANLCSGVVDDISDHPFPLLDDLGFTCTVNTDKRLLYGTSMTREMMLLVDEFDYGYTELFQLTCNAIENAFIDLPTRERILDTRIYPEYLRLTDRDNDGEIDADEDLESLGGE
ncbi:adenosine deaminase [Corynebacterium sphenisci]|uniref:adenosine deaminase n=1 Tax=Corynebacterium sphenisci TaxID=191493 RepID=UPI0026DFD1EE|nr:adenosine deaminase [Corynebacterium sphenisci]MDO5731094.1 adenosine deaminase [Corynebacterium sphenisci]